LQNKEVYNDVILGEQNKLKMNLCVEKPLVRINHALNQTNLTQQK